MSWPGLDEQVSVMPGLDPGIHDETPRTRTVLIFAVAIHHGLRVKPGNDVLRGNACDLIVMAGLGPAIHVLRKERRGCPRQARA
jgi:hypothetical protein